MENLFINSIKDALLEAGINEEIAIKSLRAFCRKYGGQKIYFSNSPEGKRASEIFDLISEALLTKIENVDITLPKKITRIFLSQFFNISEYVPLEFKAFRSEIAFEIAKEYSESKDKNKTQIEICKKYNISFVTFWKLRKEGDELKTKAERIKQIKQNNKKNIKSYFNKI